MTALVTGGGGFLGRAIVQRLLKRGEQVRSFSRTRYPHLDEWGVEQRLGDLADRSAVYNAAHGCDLVFHVAAKAGYWGPYREYYSANVVGTRHVIDACRRLGITRLVYTSSPSIVHTGQDLEGIDESFPISEHFEANYPATKAIAEKEMIAANDSTLATVALRPHLIWGPGDRHLVPRLIARAKKGHLRFIDDGSKRVDVTYIDNAADAHLCAADRLAPGSRIAGKSYFVSQGEPVAIAQFINRILAVAGLPPVRKKAPFGIAMAVAIVLESIHRGFHLPGEPRLTRFLVRQFATAHWFNISAARNELGYRPQVSTEEGLIRLAEWLRQPSGGGPISK